jgi:flagellar M-ring protein FliF
VALKPIDILKQLGAFWNGLSNAKRIALVFAVSVVAITVALIAVLNSRITYGYLYTKLESKDAASIAQKLDELKIPYTLEAGGTAIRVPEEQVHSLRLDLARDGLPSGGVVGNELFDKARLGATEFEIEVNQRRALEGELVRSIMTVADVEAARVHLVIPKRRLFAAKTEGAQASVVLTLRNNAEFGRQEVGAIVHLVAMAVPNLSPDRVTVVDSKGTTLHRPESGEGGGGVAGNEARQAEMREQEMRMAERTQTLLEKVAGPGAVEVRVKLDFDSATREQTTEQYDPKSTALRSENKVEERTATEGPTVAGVPGAETNIPDNEPTVQPREGGDLAGNFARRSHTRNWEIDRVVEKLSRPSGDLTRVSVGVLVDGRYEQREGEQVYVPRSAEELEVLRNVVRGAVGYDVKRGDTIELQSTRFFRDPAEFTVPATPEPKWLKYIVPAVAALGGLLMLSGAVLAWRGKRRKNKAAVQERAIQAEVSAEESHRLEEAEAKLLSPLGATGAGEDLASSPELAGRRREEAIQIATTDPATAAIVLREWLVAGHRELPQGAANNA